jgi:hypothetical protein
VRFVLQLQHDGRAFFIEHQLLAFCPKVQDHETPAEKAQGGADDQGDPVSVR